MVKKLLSTIIFFLFFLTKSKSSFEQVMTIQSFQHLNEKNIIYGNIAMILGQYELAQELFLKST